MIHALLRCVLVASMLLVAQASQAQLYWRADLGYSAPIDAKIRDKNFAGDGLICGDPACNTGSELNDINGSPVLGLGVGWRLSPDFRIDATFGYRGWSELDDADAFPSNFNADISSWSLMLNAYWDFALAWGRPYLGLGIGYASNKIDPIVNSASGLTITAPGGTSSDVAWALMAGISFPMSPTTTLDVGYRYIDLGKIESDSGGLSCSPACPGATYSGLSGNLRAHEFTVGVRF